MGAMQQVLQGSSAVDVDPYYSSVVLLLHMDDANPTDYSSSPKGATRSGCSSSTAQQRFGTASFVFSGPTTSYIQYANNSAFDFGTGDFTWEGWIYVAANPTSPKVIYESGNSPYTSGGGFQIYLTTSRTIACGQAFIAPLITGSTVLSLSAWYYLAATRSGTTWNLRVNGNLEGTATSAVALNATGPTTLGGTGRSGNDCLNGYLDEIRATKGVARDITSVPTAAFPNQ